MSPRLRRTLHWLGGTLGLFGVVFVVVRLREYGDPIALSGLGAGAWIGLAVLVAAFATANVLLGLAWWHLLAFLGQRPTRRWAISAYGVSQLAKYVPGNVVHLAGRQALGLGAGLAGPALLKSTLWELGTISAAGAVFAVLAVPLLWPAVPVAATLVAFCALAALAAAALARRTAPAVARAFACQIAFLAAAGAVFAATVALSGAPQAAGPGAVAALIGAYVVAWLAGLVTPGAPAGVGVREFVLLFLLGGAVPEGALLGAVIVSRVVTIAGDLAFYALASLGGVRRPVAARP